jgi:hypothetical protein
MLVACWEVSAGIADEKVVDLTPMLARFPLSCTSGHDDEAIAINKVAAEVFIADDSGDAVEDITVLALAAATAMITVASASMASTMAAATEADVATSIRWHRTGL